MPPKNYKNLTVRADVFERLESLRGKLGFGSISDLLVFLVNEHEEYTSKTSKILEIISKIPQGKLLETPVYTSKTSKEVAGSSKRLEKKRTAIEILKEQRILYEEDAARRMKDVDSFFEKLEGEGAVILKGRYARCAVDPEFWGGFLKSIGKIEASDPEGARGSLKEKEAQLFDWMYGNGLIVYDANAKKWRAA
jgi:predicted CopG family antitoxin